MPGCLFSVTTPSTAPEPLLAALLALIAVIAYSASKSKRPIWTVVYAVLTLAVVAAVIFGFAWLFPVYGAAFGSLNAFLGCLLGALVALKYSSATRKPPPPTPPPSQQS